MMSCFHNAMGGRTFTMRGTLYSGTGAAGTRGTFFVGVTGGSQYIALAPRNTADSTRVQCTKRGGSGSASLCVAHLLF